MVKRGRALLRSGAKVSDLIYVTGQLGESAAALHLLASGKIKKRDVRPQPRVSIGEWLVQKRIATSAIDISDGLSTDLAHICEESGVGAAIEAEAIPIHQSARGHKPTERQASSTPHQVENHRLPGTRLSPGGLPLKLALHGGEDYELLFTAAKSKRIPKQIDGVKITQIGEILREQKIYLIQNGKRKHLTPQGWEHFQSH